MMKGWQKTFVVLDEDTEQAGCAKQLKERLNH